MQETQAGQNEQLAMLKPDDFSTGIAIMSQDGNEYKLKYSKLLHTSHAACLISMQLSCYDAWLCSRIENLPRKTAQGSHAAAACAILPASHYILA